MDLGKELGAETYVFWGGREGVETNASKDPQEAMKWFRDALNFLCEYSISQGYDYKFALEPKPNEPRGDIFLPTIGHALALIYTLDHPEMVGLNPEVAHDTMAGLDFSHGVAQALEAGKLFHIDLNAQKPGRYDQDHRFGSEDPKAAFFLVKLLEDAKWPGMRHFDSHAYRTEDQQGVWDFAAGSMRTYLILKEKVAQFNADPEIQGILGELDARGAATGARVQVLEGTGAVDQGRAVRPRGPARAGLRLRAPRPAHDGDPPRSALRWRRRSSSASTSARAASRRFSSRRTVEVMAASTTPLSMSTPHAGWAEQDPHAWWEAALASIRTVRAACSDALGRRDRDLRADALVGVPRSRAGE